MALFCSCGHNRLEHIWGDRLSDHSVHKCNVQNCTCGKYHGSENNDNSYLYKTFLRIAVFVAVGIGAYLIGAAMIDTSVSGYEISPEKSPEQTFLVYENGTRVDSGGLESIDWKEIHTNSMKSVLGMVVFMMSYIISLIFLYPSYEYDKRKAINK